MLKYLVIIISSVFLLTVAATVGVLGVFWHYGRGLPDYQQLAHYEPSVTTRVYAGDGRLIAEYATEKRSFVPLSAMPQRVIKAFLSAEDKTFYSHPGIDVWGVMRAVVINARNLGGDRRPVGASTITQQVAKNFLLTNEVSLERKIKEVMLAFRIERAFSKDHILELYLNEIYLGFSSYGVAAAAMNYFNKSLDELTVAEAAFLAALPKAPNNYNPRRHPVAAKQRRDWVIGRMLEDGHITPGEAMAAQNEPLTVGYRTDTALVGGAGFFGEEVRRELAARYGESALYQGGLQVRSTLDPTLQSIANRALREGLVAYDRRHGWRGPIGRIQVEARWQDRLASLLPIPGLEPWQLAVVLETGGEDARIGLVDGTLGSIPFAEMRWARPWLPAQKVGPSPSRPADALRVGDVVPVEPVKADGEGRAYPPGTYALRQLPKVDGALVAMDPHTGRVLAMAGGFAYGRSQFNRATQAQRQPGSAFKPFVYLAALNNGFTPSSLILDAPVVIDQGPGLPLWKPSNYSDDFLGPTTLRVGVERSRNLMTVRLAQAVGMEQIVDYAERFGISDNLTPTLAMALGAGETTALRLTAGYAMLVNGGKRITPTIVDRVQDRTGRTIYRHDARPCPNCAGEYVPEEPMPQVPDTREVVTDPASAYQMVSILQGVVERGTGRRVSAIGKPLAGKTGTSNDSVDAWFVGFSPDLAVGVFVGFDEPHSLGDKETGSSVAAPIFKDFMAAALADKPAVPFRVPPGIRLVRVNPATGRLAGPHDRVVILEAFKPETVPTGEVEEVLGGGEVDAVGAFRFGAGANPAGVSPLAPPAGGVAPDMGGLY